MSKEANNFIMRFVFLSLFLFLAVSFYTLNRIVIHSWCKTTEQEHLYLKLRPIYVIFVVFVGVVVPLFEILIDLKKINGWSLFYGIVSELINNNRMKIDFFVFDYCCMRVGNSFSSFQRNSKTKIKVNYHYIKSNSSEIHVWIHSFDW